MEEQARQHDIQLMERELLHLISRQEYLSSRIATLKGMEEAEPKAKIEPQESH
jgi:hypothetical protein